MTSGTERILYQELISVHSHVFLQEDIATLEKQISSLKTSLQDKTVKLASSQETAKRLEEHMEEVCLLEYSSICLVQ